MNRGEFFLFFFYEKIYFKNLGIFFFKENTGYMHNFFIKNFVLEKYYKSINGDKQFNILFCHAVYLFQNFY